MADAAGPAPPNALASLPHAVAALIFAPLPVDLRARCACVCRGWHAALSAHSLWTRLDVSPRTSGVTATVTDALLRDAAARAGGALEALDVSGCAAVSVIALMAVVKANAATLTHLCVCNGVHGGFQPAMASKPLFIGDAEALLRAAPRLRAFDADVECNGVADARRALSATTQRVLRVRKLRVRHAGATPADLQALAADVALHAWLVELYLIAPLGAQAALDAVVDAALQRRLSTLYFVNCGLTPASAPALARLLGGSALTGLFVWEYVEAPLLDAPAAALLADALRANNTLTTLNLHRVRFWRNIAAATALLRALRKHPSLRTLSLVHDDVGGGAERVLVGTALGALLFLTAPALTELDVSGCKLGDAGMARLCMALPANTHLRKLTCKDNGTSDDFARNTLLPAVHVNTGLRALTTDRRSEGEREAEGIVMRRAALLGDAS
jgi:hypothetical protein